MRSTFIISLAIAITAQPAEAKTDKLCAELSAFEKADLPDNADRARWIELHWKGRWLSSEGWGLSCLHSGDDAAKRLCSYVIENTSFEFSSSFPKRILECNGFKLPSASKIANWQGEIDVRLDDDRFQRLVIDLNSERERSRAVRYISVSDETAGGTELEYLPIAPLPIEDLQE